MTKTIRSTDDHVTPRTVTTRIPDIPPSDPRGRTLMPIDSGDNNYRQQRSRSRTNSSTYQSLPGEETCDSCDRTASDVSYCNVCNTNLCEDCWPAQAAHRKRR